MSSFAKDENTLGNLQRESEILKILKEKGYATVEYLSKAIHISPSSIRRDLTHLESQGLVKRDHGGASLFPTIPGMAPFFSRLRENKKGKQAIVRAAARLIRPNSTLYLDSSTMVMNIHHYVSPEQRLTIFTNNMMLAHLLASKKIKTYCIGGRISQRNEVITAGSYALEMLKNIYVDTMFFSSSALTKDGIIFDLDEEETAIRKFMLGHSSYKVFLCQSDRFGKSAPFRLTDAGNVDYIFSDFGFPKEFVEKYPRVTLMKVSKSEQ